MKVSATSSASLTVSKETHVFFLSRQDNAAALPLVLVALFVKTNPFRMMTSASSFLRI